ncbi:NAD(P)/FAD-dependent oxidoreductase [Acidipila sp. EB88]|uniref:NAD(P)/FAD-dependent oxidoreductase n=1 Tax=Acidipila sp. EB88 TaxID=2305226 RepID=UPI000F5EA213|nr:NAD(P)/FAD-dependent oxidoreductase [Acidipila sp. EB88]RRA47740.1 NAD(P)/FAD-dependent oxidoreductase [Acidipila sp. EB88]
MASGKSTGKVFKNLAVEEHRRPRVLVLGGGFAGMNAVKALGKLPVDVTLIDKSNHNTFQPLLYQVALALLSPSDIATPMRTILRKARNVDVLLEEVTAVDTEARRVSLKDGPVMQYDYLIVATGSTKSYFGHHEWEEFAPGLKTVEDATEIRRRVLLAFELAERQAVETGSHRPLNFVVIGGGPTGVELAGAIAEIATYFMSNDFRHIDPKKSRVLLIEGGPRILPSYPQDLTDKAVKQLNKLGVEVHTDMMVEEIGPGFVKVKGGDQLDSVVTLWGAGVASSPVGAMLNVPLDKRKRVIVDKTLNPNGKSDIFVCGDLAVFVQNGKELPGVAQPALQMGAHAAKMIGQDLKGQPRNEFRYFDKGDMATIGRFSAVADIQWPFKAHWGGFPAWVTWLAVHLVFIIGFRNRVTVLAQWAWTYLFLSRGSRLITGSHELVGWKDREGVRDANVSRPAEVPSLKTSGDLQGV